MSLLSLVLTLIVVAVLLGLFNWIVRMYAGFIDARIVNIINVVVIVAVIIWVLSIFLGGFGSVSQVQVGPHR